jgi:hypothetical protein
MSRRTAIITAVVVLFVAGGFASIWFGQGGGDSNTTTLELTSS